MNDILEYNKSLKFAIQRLYGYIHKRAKIRIFYNKEGTFLHYNNIKLSKIKTKSIINLLDYLKIINHEDKILIYILENELFFRKFKKEIEPMKLF